MKNLKVNWKEFFGKRGVPLILATTMAMGLGGCGKKAECSVEESHAHLYVSNDGYRTYFDNELLQHYGYKRQDDYISLTEEDKQLFKFLEKNGLISLKDNLDTILKEAEKREDFVEYRYGYTAKKRPTPSRSESGYSWTTDPTHEGLTGESRVCHYVYEAYNVSKDENDKYVATPSEKVDDIKDLVGDYDYVKKVCYKAVNLENNEELDYEDGDPEDLVGFAIEYDTSVPVNENPLENGENGKVH